MFVLCFGFVIEFVVGFAVCRWFGLLECVLLVACCMVVVVMVPLRVLLSGVCLLISVLMLCVCLLFC